MVEPPERQARTPSLALQKAERLGNPLSPTQFFPNTARSDPPNTKASSHYIKGPFCRLFGQQGPLVPRAEQ
jgi:hypothetical protein